MYKIQGVVPISQFDSNGVEFTQEFYNYITDNKIPLLLSSRQKRGRGYMNKLTSIGEVQLAVKHRIIIFEGVVRPPEALPPYLRLCYSYREGKIAVETVGLIFSDSPGVLSCANYKLIGVDYK